MPTSVIGETGRDTQAKACVLAHRDELIQQNRSKFRRVNPGITTSGVDDETAHNSRTWLPTTDRQAARLSPSGTPA